MKLLRMVMLAPGPSDESKAGNERVLELDGEVAWELFRAGRARLEDPSDWAAVNWVLQRAAASRGDGMSAIPAAGR